MIVQLPSIPSRTSYKIGINEHSSFGDTTGTPTDDTQKQHKPPNNHQYWEGDHLEDLETDSDIAIDSIGPADNMITSKKKMRRRSRKKTLKILHLFTPGHLIILAILFLCNRMSAEPGYLDFDNLPETNFTCAGKVIGGYYADLETSCQMFHVCTIGQLDEPMDIKFLCLNGTVFDQETRVCERVDEVDCSKSEKFYYLNLELYGNTMVPMPEENESNDGSTIATIGSSSASTTKQPSPTTSSTTARPTTTRTTSARPSSSTTKRTNYPQGFNFQPQQQQRTPSYTFNGTGYNYNDPQKSQSYPTTTYSTPLYVSSTLSPKISSTQANRYGPSSSGSSSSNTQDHENIGDGQLEDELGEDEEYEYEDDYMVVTEQTNEQNKPQKPFSPQQFIFDQNKEKAKSQNTPTKPAISFQQQRFQNNGPSQFSTNHQGNQGTSSSSASGNHNHNNNNNNNDSQNPQKPHQAQQNHNKNYFIGQPAPPSGGGSQSSNDRENRPYHSTTNRPHPSYNNYYPQQEQHKSSSQQQTNQLPKRIPLLTLGQQQQQQLQNNINFQQQQQLSFRVRGSGFQLPSGPPPPPLSQPRPFAGYQRPPPPQMPLQLPFESRSLREQKDLLGFEDVAESFITPQERKDAKRSDPGAGHTINQLTERRNATAKAASKSQNAKEASYLVDDEEALEREEKQQSSLRNGEEARQTENADAIQEDNEQSGSQKRDNLKKYSTTYSQQTHARQAEQSKKVSSITTMTTTTATGGGGGGKAQKARQSFDKTLLIPQERYKSTLPKIIITASASVSANGKKLNYSLGNVLGQGAELKIPPPTYDDYKEEDVVLDPFFQDVPKIKKH